MNDALQWLLDQKRKETPLYDEALGMASDTPTANAPYKRTIEDILWEANQQKITPGFGMIVKGLGVEEPVNKFIEFLKSGKVDGKGPDVEMMRKNPGLAAMYALFKVPGMFAGGMLEQGMGQTGREVYENAAMNLPPVGAAGAFMRGVKSTSGMKAAAERGQAVLPFSEKTLPKSLLLQKELGGYELGEGMDLVVGKTLIPMSSKGAKIKIGKNWQDLEQGVGAMHSQQYSTGPADKRANFPTYRWGDIYDLEVLYKEYPQLRDRTVTFYNEARNRGGAEYLGYIDDKGHMWINNDKLWDMTPKQRVEELRKIFQHEAQHIIGRIEKWPEGAHPGMTVTKPILSMEEATLAWRFVNDTPENAYKYAMKNKFDVAQMQKVRDWVNSRPEDVLKDTKKLDDALKLATKAKTLSFDEYQQTYGESLARYAEENLSQKQMLRTDYFGPVKKDPATREYKSEVRGTPMDPNDIIALDKRFIGAVSGKAEKPIPIVPGAFPTTKTNFMRKKAYADEGFSVDMKDGVIPETGIMAGRYGNTDKHTTVIPGWSNLTNSAIDAHIAKNKVQLAQKDMHLGIFWDKEKNAWYLDVSKRHETSAKSIEKGIEDKAAIRKAHYYGQQTEQNSIWDVMMGKGHDIGNWWEFVSSPEFADRLRIMQKVGFDYMKKFNDPVWWDIHGTSLERVYGPEMVKKVAGVIGATAPNTSPDRNLRLASEYIRRYLAGEPLRQPKWRNPEQGVFLAEGKKMPMEKTLYPNIKKAIDEEMETMMYEKVRNMAKALYGEKDLAVLDRYWVRAAEKPSNTVMKEGVEVPKEIFASPKEGTMPTDVKNRGPRYEHVTRAIDKVAKEYNIPLVEFSAQVWTGMREWIRKHGELFGEKYSKGSIQGPSYSFGKLFDDQVAEKAKFLGISVKQMEKRLASGDANLLSLLVSTGVGALVLKEYLASQGLPESSPTTPPNADMRRNYE